MGYAMLAGRLPFDGKSSAELLTKHLTEEPPPLRSFAPTLSDSSLLAIQRCLAKDPASRWPDARSLRLTLGAIEDAHLPDALEAVQGHGIPGLLISSSFLFFLAFTRPPTRILWFNIGLVTFIYLFAVAKLWREGFSPRQSQHVIWTEPSWWPFWYPRSLRRPGNVWDRMPAYMRHVRSWIPAFWLYIVTAVATTRAIYYFVPKAAGILVLMLLWFVLLTRGRRGLRKAGVAASDINRVLISVPPSRVAFWARPHLAALLAPVIPPDSRRRSDSPHEQLQSIVRHASELSGPLRQLGTQAAAAARQVVASIEEIDREIAELVRNLEPGEEERLTAKIEALAPASGRDHEYAPMRQLLEKQLELIRGLQARIEEAKASRNRRLEMLKTLALHLASLRSRSAETPTEMGSLTDRVRVLCDDIALQASTLTGRMDQMETVARGAKDSSA